MKVQGLLPSLVDPQLLIGVDLIAVEEVGSVLLSSLESLGKLLHGEGVLVRVESLKELLG